MACDPNTVQTLDGATVNIGDLLDQRGETCETAGLVTLVQQPEPPVIDELPRTGVDTTVGASFGLSLVLFGALLVNRARRAA